MGPGETIALISVVVLAIVIVGVVAELYRKRLDYRIRTLELEVERARSRTPAAVDERLEARVRVLERIATDKSTDLAERIEGLRMPANALTTEVN